MNEMQGIHRRTDGSIDTDYYLARGRVRRAEVAQAALGKTIKQSGGILTALVALVAWFPFYTGRG